MAIPRRSPWHNRTDTHCQCPPSRTSPPPHAIANPPVRGPARARARAVSRGTARPPLPTAQRSPLFPSPPPSLRRHSTAGKTAHTHASEKVRDRRASPTARPPANQRASRGRRSLESRSVCGRRQRCLPPPVLPPRIMPPNHAARLCAAPMCWAVRNVPVCSGRCAGVSVLPLGMWLPRRCQDGE